MRKIIISISFFIVWAMSLQAQIGREQADSIVWTHIQNEITQPYLLYVNVNEPNAEGFVITTYNDETFKASYLCWAYWLNENPNINEPSQHRYFFVKEDDGNLLEVITSHDFGSADFASWELLSSANVENREMSSNIVLYPNPTTGVLKMENGKWKIEKVEIFDIMGRKQLSTVNYQLSINQMDISHLPNGIYFVRIQTEKKVVTEKIIKQ